MKNGYNYIKTEFELIKSNKTQQRIDFMSWLYTYDLYGRSTFIISYKYKSMIFNILYKIYNKTYNYAKSI